MWIPLYILEIAIMSYLSLSVLYLLFLGASFFAIRDKVMCERGKRNKFAILIPAHNEELLISGLCISISRLVYPKRLYETFVVADNCTDRTAEICQSFGVETLIRRDPLHAGKGYALNWGLQHIALDRFDAVVIVDADNTVDPSLLAELNRLINNGEQALQCYNSVGNRGDSWFTQLLYVSRTIGNLLYHQAKYKLGLSAYLMGNGLCFTSQLLKKEGWTAFTVGEDWEYYARLIEKRIKIGFAAGARVFHQESRNLNQATSQRLRWSSGRFHVARKLGVPLFLEGLRHRDWFTLDASLPLMLPNYSLQINLTFLALGLCFFLPATPLKTVLACVGTLLISGQLLLFVAGVFLAGSKWEVCKAVVRAPLFLIWKMAIDVLSITGMYKGERWVRTERHVSTQNNPS